MLVFDAVVVEIEEGQDGFIVHHSPMSTICSSPDGTLVKSPGADPSSLAALEREIIALRDLQQHYPGARFPIVRSESAEGSPRSFCMTRMGTHDIRDVMHDLPLGAVPELFMSMAMDIQAVHDGGFVHRDIKPGNFMVDYSSSKGKLSYCGIVDFGMSMRVNRKQDQEACLGGTRNYSHPSQLSRNHREVRCHPGQDWFALGRTMAHILVGGSEASFRAGIEAGSLRARVEQAIEAAEDEVPKWEGSQPFKDLITYSLSPESLSPDSLSPLRDMGKAIVGSQRHGRRSVQFKTTGEGGFQHRASHRPFRHDMLLIVDSTDSMSDEIEDFRNALIEVESELRQLPLDLRVDVWSLSDYNRGEDVDPVRLRGKRLMSSALAETFASLGSDSAQIDQAEAYEAALQDAYLTDKWSPRAVTTRSIVLVGDSYAHGWLTKSYWSIFYSQMKRSESEETREEYARKIGNFEERHPGALAWWKREQEIEAWKEAASNISEHDDFSARGHVYVPSSRGGKRRPNIHNALERCVTIRGATVHAIVAGEDPVARNFMKYAAMIGEGTYTEISDGELKVTLRALFASPDRELFEEFRDGVVGEDPETQVLNSITSFVLG